MKESDQMDKEWEQYRVQSPLKRKGDLWPIGNCYSLTTLSHVAPINSACRIIEDGIVRRRLIGDESILNTTRTPVVWLSPNTWGQYIYGHVKFDFGWPSIVDGKKLYWVEVMRDYSPHACRFLMTSKDVSHLNLLEYDPSTDQGPIRIEEDYWFYNGEITLELMQYDDDLMLKNSTKMSFVDRHQKIRRGDSLQECQIPASEAGAYVLSHIFGKEIHHVDHLLLSPAPNNRIESSLESSLREFVDKMKAAGNVKDLSAIRTIIQAALLAYGARRTRLATDLCELAEEQALIEDMVAEIVRSHLGRSNLNVFD